MRLYLDVDGTLLRRSGHPRLRGDFAPAAHLRQFLDFVTAHFTCVWVSSRTRGGDDAALRALFRRTIGPGDEADAVDTLLGRVRPGQWQDFKAQAMDLSTPFLWLDDAPEEESLEMLTARGLSSCWVSVDVDRHPDDLDRVRGVLCDALMIRA